MANYIKNVLLAGDRIINAITGGDPEMTISGRMGVAIALGRCRVCRIVCWFLDFFQKDHCAMQAEREKGQGDDEVFKL